MFRHRRNRGLKAGLSSRQIQQDSVPIMNQANPIPAAPKPRKPRAKKASAETATEAIQAVAAPSSETLLHVDLWTDKTPDAFQPIAAQMVSDLILGTAGTVQSSTESGLSASYRSTRQAVAAVRNLCLLIDGFSTTGNATIHAAFTLCYAGDLEHRSAPPTEPLRVLLIGAVCDVARTIPGLRFRELPPNAKAPHCATLELLTPAHHQRAASRPAPAPAALATPKPLAVSPQKPAKLPVRTPSSPAQPQPAPNPKRRMQIFAAVGAVALAAIIAFIFIPRTPAKSQLATTPATTPVAAATPPAPTPQPVPAPTVVATSKPPAEPHKQPSPAPPVKAKQPPPPQPEHETAPPPSSSGVTFSPDEIKRMIASAGKLSGDGNYDRAIALYDAVLRADRKNGAALEGRQRAVYNRDHR